jgi:hypothetical protein
MRKNIEDRIKEVYQGKKFFIRFEFQAADQRPGYKIDDSA